jgi:hypothetical protein
MTNEEIKKRFIAFLHEEGITRQYVRNCQKDARMFRFRTVSKKVDNIMKDIFGAGGLISCDFTWRKTPEGYDFWSRVSDRWERIVDAMYNEQPNIDDL